jgi:hypothetical protein
MSGLPNRTLNANRCGKLALQLIRLNEFSVQPLCRVKWQRSDVIYGLSHCRLQSRFEVWKFVAADQRRSAYDARAV